MQLIKGKSGTLNDLPLVASNTTLASGEELVGKSFLFPSPFGRGARGEGAKREGKEETKGGYAVLVSPSPRGRGRVLTFLWKYRTTAT